MLVEIPYKEGDTVSLKLTSGEEVIARLDKESNDSYQLHKPLMVVANQQGLGLAPFMFTVSPDAKFNLNSKNVLCVVKTEDEMAKQYVQNTTGLQVV